MAKLDTQARIFLMRKSTKVNNNNIFFFVLVINNIFRGYKFKSTGNKKKTIDFFFRKMSPVYKMFWNFGK